MKKNFLHFFITYALFCLCAEGNAQGGLLPLNNNVSGIINSSVPDLWDITTTADGLLRLTFAAAAPADLFVTLYDNNGTSIIGAPGESFNNSIVTLRADGLAPGTYHVKVSRFSASTNGAYTLADSLFTTSLANDQEPNGTPASAVTLPLNGKLTGHLGYYYNNQHDTADWYKVTTTTDGLLRVYLSTARGSIYSNNPLDVNVTLYDNNKTAQLANVEVFNGSNPATGIITTDGLAPGTYYIKVQPYSTSEFANYTLTDTLFTTALANDQEPNGTPANAITLPVNNKLTGHVGYYYNNQRDTADWYKVTTTTDGLLRVYLATLRGSIYSNNPLDVNVTLYDNNKTAQLANVEVFNGNNPATGIITTDGLAPGTYYIKVQPYSTSEFANYTLTDTLFTTALANDQEPNGTPANAITLPVNNKLTGHVGYYYNNQRDTADWYKVTTTTDGLLRVYLATLRGSIYSNNPLDVNVTLYDNNKTAQLANVEVFNGNNPATGIITTDGLAPGTYYIKVQPYSTSEFANYTLTDTLFTTALASDQEPNGTPASAVTLPLNDKLTGKVGYLYNNQRDTADWYKVTTTTDGLLRVYLSTARGSIYSNNPLDVNLTLYDGNGTTQLGNVEAFNGNNPATGIITKDGLAPGTYYIKVQPYSTSEFANYTLTDSLFTPPLAKDAEPNGSIATAIGLPLNGGTTGHVGYYSNQVRDTADWYKVTTTTDGLLRVYLTTDSGSKYSTTATNPLDVNVLLYDHNGTTLLGNVEVFNGYKGATNLITKDGLAAGTYYIKVQPYSTSEFANYILSDTLYTKNITSDAEPNGSIATALSFQLGSITRGHSGYYYNNQRDTADWYKIIVPGTIPLHLYLNAQPTSSYSTIVTDPIDMVMTLYSSNGTTQLGSREIFNRNGPATDSLFFPSLAAGTYFLRVSNFSTNEFAYYTLKNALTPSGANLPVTFINFDGVLQNNQAILTWSTAMEINNKGFDIQKSMDGQAFHSIGFVDGQGNSSLVNNYSFVDSKIPGGYNYYRLKQVDLDGNFIFSSTIRLDFKKFGWTIFGNPLSTSSWVQIQLAQATTVAVQIISADGKIIKTINKGNLGEGVYSIPLNLGNAPAGMYIIQLITDKGVFSKTVIK